MNTVNNSATDTFKDREIYPLPGGTNYYQPIIGITITPSKHKEYYTKDEIDKIIADVISSEESREGIKTITCTFEELPVPAKENLGTIINVSDGFITDDRFIDGPGKHYPSNTNLIITYNIDTNTYAFDVMMGEIKSATDSEIQDIIDDLYKD